MSRDTIISETTYPCSKVEISRNEGGSRMHSIHECLIDHVVRVDLTNNHYETFIGQELHTLALKMKKIMN